MEAPTKSKSMDAEALVAPILMWTLINHSLCKVSFKIVAVFKVGTTMFPSLQLLIAKSDDSKSKIIIHNFKIG